MYCYIGYMYKEKVQTNNSQIIKIKNLINFYEHASTFD